MYDELVRRLRAQADAERYFVGEDMLYDKAADVIEELCGLCADQSKDCSEAVAKYLELWEKQPRWIPVTERKPKTDDIVIVAIHDDSGDTPYDVTNVGFYLDVFPLGIWVVENERCNYVTHWMPLPSTEEVLTGTDTRGGIHRDDAGNVIDWGITGPPGDVGKTEDGE